MRFQVTQVMDAIEQRLTTDVTLAQAVADLGPVVRDIELDHGRPVSLVRIGMVIDALSRHLLDGGAMLYGVVDRALLSEQSLTSKERMVLSRWTDDGLIEVVPSVGDRVFEVADLTGLPVVALPSGSGRSPAADPELARRYGWLTSDPGRLLRLGHRDGVAVLTTFPDSCEECDGTKPVVGRARVSEPDQSASDPPGPAASEPADEAAAAAGEAAAEPAGESTAAAGESASEPAAAVTGTDVDAPAEAADQAAVEAGDSDPAAAEPDPPGADAQDPAPGGAAPPEAGVDPVPAKAEAEAVPAKAGADPVPANAEPEAVPAKADAGPEAASDPAGDGKVSGSMRDTLRLPFAVFAGRGVLPVVRTRISWRRFRRAEPNRTHARLLSRLWRCDEFECPVFGEHRRIGQPVPRLRDGVPVCPRHDTPVADAGPRLPAHPVSIVVDDLPRRRLVVESGHPLSVGSAEPDPDDLGLVSVAPWLHRAASAWIAPRHLRLEVDGDGLLVTDLSGHGTVVWQRSGPDEPGTATTLRGTSYRFGEWDSVELYTGIELMRGDRRLAAVLDRYDLASVLLDAPTAAQRQLPSVSELSA